MERDGLEYRTGDCTLLIRGTGIDSRPYSFSSHPNESVLRFLIRRIETKGSLSSFSDWLSSLGPGDEIGVGTPFGWFRPGQSHQEVWFATGTGISPFLSSLRANSPLTPLALFIGVRTPAETVLKSWIQERAPAQWAYSQPTNEANAARRVTDFAGEVPVSPQISYFLCGNQRMIRDVAEILKSRGVAAPQIHEELFFR